MHGFFVRRDEEKVAVVERCPLTEVRLYLHELSIDIIMIVFPRDEEQKWKHCVRKLPTIHCFPLILITEERKRQMKSNTDVVLASINL